MKTELKDGERVREPLEELLSQIMMQKKGRLSKEEKEREAKPEFKKLKNKHSAIESNINCLEHHGLDRCPDRGREGFGRYVGLGVLAYNMHKIGNHLLSRNKVTELKKYKEKQKEKHRKAG